jgi:hypothetical protein
MNALEQIFTRSTTTISAAETTDGGASSGEPIAELRPPAGLNVSANVACGGCLLSDSIEETTKVRSRKHGIRRDEPTCDEEKSLTSILSLSEREMQNRLRRRKHVQLDTWAFR